MEQYKQEFIGFMVDSQVLKFGDFTLKSGRKSPFFMNAGAYVTGTQLRRLGEYYARAIHDHYGLDFDVLFGPAYKGIPLSVATTMAISELYGREVRYCSNRKEVKDHGDTGILLGSKLKDGDRVVIIEDVTTSGESIEKTFHIRLRLDDWEGLFNGFPGTGWSGGWKVQRAHWKKLKKNTDLKRTPSLRWKMLWNVCIISHIRAAFISMMY